ncbi:outer membrane protein [Engelhardtia mirabilis]|uniref:Outer membrane protein beta-barrel domain-containing protein n=1 Tax=Engelhardtia mirabilis TaxID=2528011 RepID=A0A518BP09_9BACT|nr:hypothetical protein Pla133_38170 [Planctomycetes bacterium Pla133]QDV03041.1 hypothetical protein Pla86_38160 [Planctomycetes bacterium Pla86]
MTRPIDVQTTIPSRTESRSCPSVFVVGAAFALILTASSCATGSMSTAVHAPAIVGMPIAAASGAEPSVAVEAAAASPSAVSNYPLPLSAVPYLAAKPVAQGGGVLGGIGVILGRQKLDDTAAWDGIDNPGVFGMQGWIALDDEGVVALETAVGLAYDSTDVVGVDVDALFTDLTAGLRLGLPIGDPGGFQLRPYVGGGVALASVEVTGDFLGSTVSDDDTTVGFYAHVGVNFPVTEHFEIGADFRILRGTDVTLGGIDTDIDSNRFVLYLGYAF